MSYVLTRWADVLHRKMLGFICLTCHLLSLLFGFIYYFSDIQNPYLSSFDFVSMHYGDKFTGMALAKLVLSNIYFCDAFPFVVSCALVISLQKVSFYQLLSAVAFVFFVHVRPLTIFQERALLFHVRSLRIVQEEAHFQLQDFSYSLITAYFRRSQRFSNLFWIEIRCGNL